MNCGTLKGWQKHKSTNTRCCEYCAPYDPRLANPKKEVVIKQKPGPTKGTRLSECGTMASVRRHWKSGQELDSKCQAVNEAFNTNRRALNKARKERVAKGEFGPASTRDTCGTTAGFHSHRYYEEDACDPRLAAIAEYNRARYKPAPPREPKTRIHGTSGGRTTHIRLGEPVCDPCRIAYNAATRKAYDAKKKAATQ